jgi:hypothetical protein
VSFQRERQREREMDKKNTAYFTDLDYGCKMIIFGSILTTFISRAISLGAVVKIDLSLKSNHLKQI